MLRGGSSPPLGFVISRSRVQVPPPAPFRIEHFWITSLTGCDYVATIRPLRALETGSPERLEPVDVPLVARGKPARRTPVSPLASGGRALQAELFRDPPRIATGWLTLKDAPGWGQALSKAALAKFGEHVL